MQSCWIWVLFRFDEVAGYDLENWPLLGTRSFSILVQNKRIMLYLNCRFLKFKNWRSRIKLQFIKNKKKSEKKRPKKVYDPGSQSRFLKRLCTKIREDSIHVRFLAVWWEWRSLQILLYLIITKNIVVRVETMEVLYGWVLQGQ